MAEQVQHPTTEKLSASLDGQLSSQEQAHIDEHLQTCEQCQLELASLRQTVALLRALPQPALPRSFALPIEKAPIPIAALSPKAPTKTASTTTGTIKTSKRPNTPWPGYIRSATRVMSTLAAVLGIFILFSSLFMTFSFMRGSAGSAVQNASTTSAPQAPSAGDNGKNVNQQSTSVPPYSSAQATQTAHQAITPTPSTDATATPETTDKLSKGSSGGPEPNSRNNQEQLQLPSPLLSVLEFFDLGTPVGWMRLGVLLLIVGVLGRVLLRPRKQADISARS